MNIQQVGRKEARQQIYSQIQIQRPVHVSISHTIRTCLIYTRITLSTQKTILVKVFEAFLLHIGKFIRRVCFNHGA